MRRLITALSALLLTAGIAQAQGLQSFVDKVVPAVEAATGLTPDGTADGFCIKEGYCQAWFGPVQVQFTGRGIVEALTTTQLPHSTYRDVCAAIFAGLNETDIGFARELMDEAFARAGNTGRFERWIRDTEITVRPDYDGVLGCEFFRSVTG